MIPSYYKIEIFAKHSTKYSVSVTIGLIIIIYIYIYIYIYKHFILKIITKLLYKSTLLKFEFSAFWV